MFFRIFNFIHCISFVVNFYALVTVAFDRLRRDQTTAQIAKPNTNTAASTIITICPIDFHILINKNHKHTTNEKKLTTNLATIRLCQYCYQAPVNWNRTIFKKLLSICKNDNYRCYESWRVGRSRCRLWSIRFIDRYHDLLTFQINVFKK